MDCLMCQHSVITVNVYKLLCGWSFFMLAGLTSVHAADNIADAVPTENIVATVNGKPVRGAVLDVLIRTRSENTNPYDEPGATSNANADAAPPVDRIKAISDLILTKLMAQKAIDLGIDKRPEVQAEMELMSHTLLQQLLVRDIISHIKIDEAEIVERYKLQQPERLYQVSHILAKDAESAKARIVDLEKGASFSALAHQYSTDPYTKKDGSLGWLMLNQMQSGVAAAVSSLHAGEFTKTPVKALDGWHVLLVRAVRDLPKTPYAEMRGALRQRLLVEKVNEQVAQLSRQADIKVLTK